jgi:hypothetical protein
MCKALDWNPSRISMLEVEAVGPDGLEYGFIEE